VTDPSGPTPPPEHPDSARVCALCGSPLTGRRMDARVCSDPCRIEASRLRRLLAGETVGPYSSVADRLRAARSRTRTPLAVAHESWTTPTGEGGPGREPEGSRSLMPVSQAQPASREERVLPSARPVPAQGCPPPSYAGPTNQVAGRCANSPRPA
jgi:hypothetical protein